MASRRWTIVGAAALRARARSDSRPGDPWRVGAAALDRLLRPSERIETWPSCSASRPTARASADHHGCAAGDRPGVLARREADRVLAAGRRDLPREPRRDRPAQAQLQLARQPTRLVAGRQAIAFLRSYGAQWRVYVMSAIGRREEAPAQAPPAGRPSWTANSKSILIPSGGDMVKIDAETGKVQKRFGMTIDIQISQNATVSPDARDSRLRRPAPQHGASGLRGGPVPAVRPLPGQHSGASSPATDRQRHRPGRLVAGREEPRLRRQGGADATRCQRRRPDDDRNGSARRGRRRGPGVAAALIAQPGRTRRLR